MKKILLFLLPLCILLPSCGEDPLRYNDALVDHIEIATKRVNEVYNLTEDAFNTNDFSKLKEQTKATTDSLKIDIEKINALKQPSDADDFHNSTIAYIGSLISYVEAIGDQYSQVTDSTTDEQLQAMDNVIDNIQKVYETKLNNMISAQKEFAKAKNFELKNIVN